MSKHTPGPWGWVIHDHSLATLGVLPDLGLGDPHVLSLGPCTSCQKSMTEGEWVWGKCHTPSEADAALIAAAPDLLEALKYVRRFVKKSDVDVNFLDAAIAKAEGRP